MTHSSIFSRFTTFLIVSLLIFPFNSAIAAPYITLEEFSGPATSVVVSGGGWTPGEMISVYLSNTSGSPAAQVTAGSDSFFGPLNVPVPNNTPQGALPIIAVGATSGGQQTNSYYIVPFTPTIAVSGNNTPGSNIAIVGDGFAPNELVRFLFNGSELSLITANNLGSFGTGRITVPNIAAGTYQIHAIGQGSGATAVEYFYVGGFFPSITPSTYYLLPGQTLNFSGSGFASGETIHIYDGQSQTSLGTIVADSTGSFTDAGQVIIPLSASGAKTFRLHGQTSGGSASVDVSVGAFNPFISPSAHYVLPDQLLSFTGSGYAGNEIVRIYEGNIELAQLTTDADGNFADAGLIRIPFDWLNSARTFTFIGHMSGASGNVIVAIGQFDSLASPSSYHITPGEELRFTGHGFAANEAVYVHQGQGTKTLSMITADESGAFVNAGAMTIPFAWADSSQTFYLEGQSSHTVAPVIVTVAAFAPQVAPSIYYLSPGSDIAFTGTGFGKREDVAVDQLNGPRLATISADENGAFENAGVFAIPYSWVGKQSLSFIGLSSNASAEADITIAPFMPMITPSTFYVSPGELIYISGTGFAPDEEVLITMNNGSPISALATSTGGFTDAGPFTAPLAGETLHIVATGANSNTPVETDITLAALYPSVTPDLWYLPSGGTILFSGTGFGPQEQVRLTRGTTELALITTDDNGSFADQSVVTDFGETREVIYTFTGLESGAAATAAITVAGLQPYLSLDTYYAQPGTPLAISGSGFSPSELIDITIGSATVQTAADAAGSFETVPMTLPFGLTGESANVSATGRSSGAAATTQVTLAPFMAEVSPSTWYTPGGSTVTFTGNGFASGETVTILINTVAAGSATADAQGSFTTAPLSIPFGSLIATFRFVGTTSNATVDIPISVAQLYPGVELSVYYAGGGTPLVVTGNGFAANEEVQILFAGEVLGTASADTNGAFMFNSTVPYLPAGDKTVQATGQLSGAIATAPFTQPPVYSASAQLGSYAGAPGAAITFVGSGFIPGETMSITTDRTGSTVVHTFTADASGNFTDAGYIVPADFAEGPLTVTITGAWSYSTTNITYYVTGM